MDAFPVKFILKISLYWRIEELQKQAKTYKNSEQIWTIQVYGLIDQWKISQDFIADCLNLKILDVTRRSHTGRRHESN